MHAQSTTTPAQANEAISLSAWHALNRAVVLPTSGNTKLDALLAEVERFTRETVIPAGDEHTAAEDAVIAARAIANAEGATNADKLKLKEAERLEAATDSVWIRAYEKRDRMLSRALKAPVTNYEEVVLKAEASVLLHSDLNHALGETCDYGLLKIVATQLAADVASLRAQSGTNAALERAIKTAQDYDRDVRGPAWKAYFAAEEVHRAAEAAVKAIPHPPELIVLARRRMVSVTMTYSDGTVEVGECPPRMETLLSPDAIRAHVDNDEERAGPMIAALEAWWEAGREPLAALKLARQAAEKADRDRYRKESRFAELADRILDVPVRTPAAAARKLQVYATLWEAKGGRPENLDCDTESEAALATAFNDLQRMAGVAPGPDNSSAHLDPMLIAAE